MYTFDVVSLLFVCSYNCIVCTTQQYQAMRFFGDTMDEKFNFAFMEETVSDFLNNLDKFDFMQPAGSEKSIKDWFKAGKSKWMPPLFVEAFEATDDVCLCFVFLMLVVNGCV